VIAGISRPFRLNIVSISPQFGVSLTIDDRGRAVKSGGRCKERDMSVPGRIGTILILALAMLDGLILASGARKAASALEIGGMTEIADPGPSPKHCCLLTSALHRIDAFRPTHAVAARSAIPTSTAPDHI
jgi:hypothetical protein